MKRFLAFFLLFCFSLIPIHANSAQYWWSGSDSTGVMTDGNSPIEVIHEDLIFDLHDYPDFSDGSSFNDQYSSTLTAEYTFSNPEDYAVSLRLMFPYGLKPDYNPEINPDSSIKLLVDGKPVDYQIRHTYSRNLSEFSLESDLHRLHDAQKLHDFYTPDLPVTKITLEITELDDKTYPSARLDLSFTKNDPSFKVYLFRAEGVRNDDSYLILRKHVQKHDLVTLYLFGKTDDQLLQPIFYSNGGCTIQIDGKAEVIASQTMTLTDLIMEHYPIQTGILEHDWYNAFIDMLSYHTSDLYIEDMALDVSYSLMQWIDYSIQIDPHSTLIHSVTAPIYPGVNESYEPPVYSYTYLLSPAKSWTRFQNLNIEIHTDSFLKNPSLQGFEKTDFGYQFYSEALPESELTFELCAAQFPKKRTNYQYIPMMLLNLFFAGIPVLLIVLLILFFIKSKIHR